MDGPAGPGSGRLRLGFVLLIALLALGAAGKAILYDTMDPDCFWHLRVAEQLHRDGIGPIVDDLSFASSSKPWTPYSWLAELGMKAIWDAGGYRAAVATQAMMQGMIVVFLAMGCLEMQESAERVERNPNDQIPNPNEIPMTNDQSGTARGEFGARAIDGARPGYLGVAVTTAAGTFLTLPYLSFRPVTAAFVILAACTWLILRDRRLGERSRAVWLIVPLTVLLTNIHLFAFFVPAVVGVLWVGAVLEWAWFHKQSFKKRAELAAEAASPRGVRRYGVLLFWVTGAYLCTPMLPGLLRTVFFYGAQDRMVSGPMIAEMQSFANGPMGIAAAVIVGLAFVFLIVHIRRVRVGEIVCFIFGSVLLFKLGRFAPVFVMAMCPIFAVTGPALKDRILGKPVVCALLGLVLMIGAFRIIEAFPQSDRTLSAWLNRHGPDAPGYPCDAAAFVQRNVAVSTGRIINEFSWGGYLAYALGDKYKILLDGRTQVYPAKLWQATYLSDAAELAKFLATIRADAAVLPAGTSQFHSALADLGWTTAYHDVRAEVMLPPGGVARIEP